MTADNQRPPVCPACVNWTCRECGHRRHGMNSGWKVYFCPECHSQKGIRSPVRHTSEKTAEKHIQWVIDHPEMYADSARRWEDRE